VADAAHRLDRERRRGRPAQLLLQRRHEVEEEAALDALVAVDRKSTRLNSSHVSISYAVFCLKKKNIITNRSSDLHEERSLYISRTAAVQLLLTDVEMLHDDSFILVTLIVFLSAESVEREVA